MAEVTKKQWRNKLSTMDKALSLIEPGKNIFIGTGPAEPRSLVRGLMTSEAPNLQDLTLIQILSFGEAISLEALQSNKYRLKTFFSGWVAGDAIAAGRVDLIHSRFSTIPWLIKNRLLPIDVAVIQITPPESNGLCSLGLTVDVTRRVMDQAQVVIGEISRQIPCTYGDTFVRADSFDVLVESTETAPVYPPFEVADVFDKLAANVASVIEDGSCLAFTLNPLFEALPKYLSSKRDLGIHSPFMSDPLMKLIESGAVTNRRKRTFLGKSVACYAMGSTKLLQWLDRNPLVEFQSINKVLNPIEIGKNPRFVAIFPARKVDLAGNVALHAGQGKVTSGPGQAMDCFNGAEISPGGFTIFGLPSRNLKGESNIRISLKGVPNQLNLPDSINMIATEYGTATLSGRTLRERAQALIEVAHPKDRPTLVEKAKASNILYADQIFIAESAHLYPTEIAAQQTFKNDVTVRFRAIKPSDEEEMRRLFYRFSDEAIYYRYFSPIQTMPHAKMQAYVNVDYRDILSVVGLVGPPGRGRIIAEARYARHKDKPYVDVAFVVDEEYQGLGIATFLFKTITRLAQERGAKGITADVLATNQAMLKVFEKGGYPMRSHLEDGAYSLTLSFES